MADDDHPADFATRFVARRRLPGLTCDTMDDWRDCGPNDGLLHTDLAAVATTDHDDLGFFLVLGRMKLQ